MNWKLSLIHWKSWYESIAYFRYSTGYRYFIHNIKTETGFDFLRPRRKKQRMWK